MQVNLNDLVDDIKNFLNLIDINVPFFIAGGSVFSIINRKSVGLFKKSDIAFYNDIDIYLYSEKDFNSIKDNFESNPISKKMETIETKNALTIKRGSKADIQFIKKSFLPVNETLNQFDLSCSKCCITSNGEYIEHRDFSKIVTLYPKIQGSHLNRLYKYIYQKNAIDPDYKELKRVINYFVINYDKMFESDYNEEGEAKGIVLLYRFLHQFIDEEIHQYIHDMVLHYHSNEYVRISIFEEIITGSRGFSLNFSDEALVVIIKQAMKSESYIHTRDGDNERIILKYPEFFL